MIRHLLKLVWNRKKTNALVVLEIFISFVVVFAVIGTVAVFANNYRQPLGFSYEDVVTISVTLPSAGSVGLSSGEENSIHIASLVRETRRHPGVLDTALADFAPYDEGNNTGEWLRDGKKIAFARNNVSDDFAKVMGLRVVQGRWFSKEHDGLSWQPVVIDRDFARALYGSADPIGKPFDPEAKPPTKVVGVVEEFRKEGEFSPRDNYVFTRYAYAASEPWIPRNLLVKLSSGVYSPEWENGLLRHLERTVPGVSLVARPLSQQRETALRNWLVPVLIGALISLFLILMVALGLTGVMWQNVTQRTGELGLRRALGAERSRVRRQILGEIILIATLGLILGVAVVAQVPLMGLFSFLEGTVFIVATVASLGLIYALAVVCGLYPSWLASRIEPAQALHYE